MLIFLKKKAQSTAEYVTLFAIVVGGITMVKAYSTKGIAGKLQAAAKMYDDVGNQADGDNGSLPGEANGGNWQSGGVQIKDDQYRLSESRRMQGGNDGLQKFVNGVGNREPISVRGSGMDEQRKVIAGDIDEVWGAVDGTAGDNAFAVVQANGIDVNHPVRTDAKVGEELETLVPKH